MLRRLFLTLLCFVAALTWQAPASLADRLVRDFSKGSLALIGAEGSLWSGSAMLAAPDQSSGRFMPFMQVRWAWHPSFLLRGELHWQFESGGYRPGVIAITPSGPKIEMLKVGMPARYALERIPHAIGRAGWRGDMLLFVQRWQCSWRARCSGDANLQWFGAGSDLFPLRQFGDYQLNVHSQEDVMDLQLATMRGEIHIEAGGKFQMPQHFELAGVITGDPAFVGRLPNIAGGLVTPDGSPGRMKFSFRQ